MSAHPVTDLGSNVVTKFASIAQDSSGDPKIVTAGATEDGAEVEGETIDRQGKQSGVVQIPWIAKLAQDKTLSLTVKRQESSDNSTWDTAVEIQAATVVATGGTGGSTEMGVTEIDENYAARKRYVRYNITPTMSATGTDIAIWAATATLGGADALPAA